MKRNFKYYDEVKKCDVSPKLAEVKIKYRSNSSCQRKINGPQDSFNVLLPLFDINTMDIKEEFFLLLLNRGNRFLGWFKVSSGGTAGTTVDVKMVYILALLANASGIILGHNHPSWNLKPSEADVAITNKIKEAGKLLEISVLDHLIVNSNREFFAFSQQGLL